MTDRRPAATRFVHATRVWFAAMAFAVGCGSTTQLEDDAMPSGDGPIDAVAVHDSATTLDANDVATRLDAGLTDAALTLDIPVLRDAGAVDTSVPDVPPSPPTSALLLDGTSPMPCADPSVFSENDADATFYVYCTSMSHVWRTTDWVHFTDERSVTRFDLTGLSANGQQIGSWWAPGIVYAPDLGQYVMWVSVPAAVAVRTATGWDTRALATLMSSSPTGPWIFRGLPQNATSGQMFIDPFPFRDHDGRRYVYWKQYGGGLPSRIRGANVDASWRTIVAGSPVDVMNGYGGTGTWEMDVRENPSAWFEAGTNRHHLLFSGGHWAEDNYATGHAVSTCGPLCPPTTAGGWHMVSSGDRGIVQVVRSFSDANFTFGGPGGANIQDHVARHIIYAAAAHSATGDHTRYLMRDAIRWQMTAPFVDTAGHRPLGL